jgi:hypothetical protein
MAPGNKVVSDTGGTVSQHNTIHISTKTESVAIQTAAIVKYWTALHFKHFGYLTSDRKSTSEDKLQT